MCIGVEVENLIYRSDLTRLPVNPGEHFSAVELRNSLETLCVEAGISPSLTMEPGGQIEFGGSPFRNLHEVNTEWQKYLGLL
jgi:gamma-glutamylcysteine synthetase